MYRAKEHTINIAKNHYTTTTLLLLRNIIKYRNSNCYQVLKKLKKIKNPFVFKG